MIDGHAKDWSQLTPAERARIHAAFDEARRSLANAHIDRARIQAEVQAAMAEAQRSRGDGRREIAQAHREVEQAMREIDRNSAELRRHGQDPEALKATVRASLKAVEAIDVEAITRRAMASVDPAMIERSLQAAQEGMRQAQAAIDAAERESERGDAKDDN
jgi:phage-related tail protein